MRLRKNWNYILRNRNVSQLRRLCFLFPSFVGVCYFVMLPFGKVLFSSFFKTLSGEFVGFQNFITVLQNEAFQTAAENTIRFMLIANPILLILSLGIALMISSNPKYDRYKYLYLMPLAMPAATMVLVWKLLFSEQGFLNKLLGTHIDFLGEESAFYIFVGSYLWKNLGYTMVLWIAGLKTVSGEILDAAKVDGAGKIQCFIQIILPSLKGSVFTICVVSILNSFKVFREVYLVGGAYPQKSIYLIQNVFNNWYTNLEQDKMAAGAVIMLIILGGLSLLLQKLWD